MKLLVSGIAKSHTTIGGVAISTRMHFFAALARTNLNKTAEEQPISFSGEVLCHVQDEIRPLLGECEFVTRYRIYKNNV